MRIRGNVCPHFWRCTVEFRGRTDGEENESRGIKPNRPVLIYQPSPK